MIVIFKLLFHFAFFAVFLTAVNSGKNPRTDGVSCFMKMVGVLTFSAYRGFEASYLFMHKCSCLLRGVKFKLFII